MYQDFKLKLPAIFSFWLSADTQANVEFRMKNFSLSPNEADQKVTVVILSFYPPKLLVKAGSEESPIIDSSAIPP